ncbi:MAG: creatininase family protein [Deltaproteobacteria bacterium]|nr:creatininase family protein [Deltaproteobacteria bacterium]MBW2072491.1 creatininase family protein [Deltaproteobacteria bacterium]
MIIEEITMPDFIAGLERTRTVLLPCGSVEEHGPHLPLGTDTIHVYELCKEVARRTEVFVAPPVHYGLMRSTREHPGTIGIRGSTLRAVVRDIVSDLYRQGLRNFLIISGHASALQISSLVETGEELLERHPEIGLAVLSALDVAPRAWQEIIVSKDDSHAGEVETSLMLFLRNSLVGSDRPKEKPHFPPHLLVRDKQRYWPGGVWGDAGHATREKGQQLFERSVQAMVALIDALNSHNNVF